MAHNYSQVNTHLVRGEIWADMLKERLEDDLMAANYVNWMDFTDGTTLTIPSIGGATVRDYEDDTDVTFDAFDTGEFQFSGFNYLSSGTYITKKAREDAHYSAMLEARFVPEQVLALEKKLETDILAAMDGGQTADDFNLINGAQHRWVGTEVTAFGAATAAGHVGVSDLSRARYALGKANVPLSNLIGIVNPEVALHFEALATANGALTQKNPMWEPLVASGLVTGMRFALNILGFDLYVSNYLPTAGTAETAIDGLDGSAYTAVASDQKNFFFSAADKELMNVMGAWRRQPDVESDYNMNKQREEYIVTSRYGIQGGYRPENMITIMNNSTI
jgi:hypothetical protein